MVLVVGNELQIILKVNVHFAAQVKQNAKKVGEGMAYKVKIIKEKRSWNGKRIMARVGQQGILCDTFNLVDLDKKYIAVRIYLEGHSKGVWIMPYHLELLE